MKFGEGVDACETAAVLELDYGAGRVAELTLSWISSERLTSLQIVGSDGSLAIDGETLRIKSSVGQFEEHFEALDVDSWHPAWSAATAPVP